MHCPHIDFILFFRLFGHSNYLLEIRIHAILVYFIFLINFGKFIKNKNRGEKRNIKKNQDTN